MENKFQKLRNTFPQVEENVLLKDYSTFRIGGAADYLFKTGNSEELKKVIDFCNDNQIDFLVIGGGSNVLISDAGFRGLIIVYKSPFGEFNFNNDGSNEIILNLKASIVLSEAVIKISNGGYSGFEWAVGIPGTIGGAINGNAGAFKSCISDSVREVKALQLGKPAAIFKKEECGFEYRSSIFKKSLEYIVTEASFVFKKEDKDIILGRIKDNLEKRGKNQPKAFSAGSVFKNHEGRIDKRYFKKYPELEKFSEDEFIPAGYLIDKCNLKGMKIGDAQIDLQKANFIINIGEARADNVLKLINIAKKEVKERFGILLQEEIKYIGEFK